MKRYDEKRAAAVCLRRDGYSYNIISERLDVPKSTLSYWVSDLDYKPNEEVLERIGKARARSGETKGRQKRQSIIQASEEALEELGELSQRDIFVIGIALYIGEGSKTHDHIRIINADPRVIQLAVIWFKQVAGMTNDNFCPTIHIYPDNDMESCLSYWSSITGIPRANFGKTQVDKRKNKKMGKKGKLPYGTAHLNVKANGNREHGVFLARKIRAWMDEVFEQSNNAGIV